ncbi:MAG: gephyrin-like molybdotransferase Glp [Bryobacteraceae bacterium]
MATYSFRDARECVIARVRSGRRMPETEEIGFAEAAGRVLAEAAQADRDYPSADRSIRDGFAVRAEGFTGSARVSGEVRAGEAFAGTVAPGEAVEIMTGAPMPAGADAVIMVEHVRREDGRIVTDRAVKPGNFVNPRGSEAKAGATLVPAGRRLGFADIALLATIGRESVRVFRQPRVAILATGDEIVEVHETPAAFQIRNSNSYSLAVQARRAGAAPEILPVARDNYDSTRALIERGLQSDLLLISGGVSAGKYDIVEKVLADLGAEFFFDRVLIQPGQPLVFGRARESWFFGLPGNPASTMVTFEIFARAAVELLGGQEDPMLPLLESRLACDFRHKPGLTRFLPASLSPGGEAVTPIPWQGSSDVPALARANAFLVADPDRPEYKAGDAIKVVLK